MDTKEILGQISHLIDDWCDQRNLKALEHILPGWPIGMGLTDDWARVLEALKNVRAFSRDTLNNQEIQTIDDLISEIERTLYHRD